MEGIPEYKNYGGGRFLVHLPEGCEFSWNDLNQAVGLIPRAEIPEGLHTARWGGDWRVFADGTQASTIEFTAEKPQSMLDGVCILPY